MTEAEWLVSSDPEAMLRVIAESHFRTAWPDGPRTERKRFFFGAACCRLVWPLIAADSRLSRAVIHLEHQFDTPGAEEHEDEIWLDVKVADRHPDENTPPEQALAAHLVADAGSGGWEIGILLRSLAEWGDPRMRAAQIADIMRDVVGNPFRASVCDPRWRTPTVLGLACVYDCQAFDRLPVLADALEEVGCDQPDILTHCRGPGPHVRGCWVVDLVLGKS